LRRNVAYRNQSEFYYFRDPYAVCFSGGPSCLFCQELVPLFLVIESYLEYELLNPEDDIQGDNIYDYLVFRNWSADPNYNVCLDVNEMNFYYESMEDFAFGVLPNPIGYRVIAQIEVGYSANFSFSTHIWHAMEVMTIIKLYILEGQERSAIELPCCN